MTETDELAPKPPDNSNLENMTPTEYEKHKKKYWRWVRESETYRQYKAAAGKLAELDDVAKARALTSGERIKHSVLKAQAARYSELAAKEGQK